MDYALQRYPLEALEYSTTNFVVGEFILKAMTGQMIQMVTQDLVFAPLGLENMELPDRFINGVLPDPAATPYMGPSCLGKFSVYGLSGGFDVYQDITEFPHGIVMAGTGGAINSNIYDLLAWAKSGTGDDLLTEEIVQCHHEICPGGTVYPQYGIALIQLSSEWYGHSGDAFRYSIDAW